MTLTVLNVLMWFAQYMLLNTLHNSQQYVGSICICSRSYYFVHISFVNIDVFLKIPCVIIIVDTSRQYISWPLDDSDDRPVELETFAKTLEQQPAARLRATARQTGNKYHPVMNTYVGVNCHNRTDLWAIWRHCIMYTVLVSLRCLSDDYTGKAKKEEKNFILL